MLRATTLTAAAVLSGAAFAQAPGVVDLDPTPPPHASWPVLVDATDGAGTPGTDLGDTGSGRGQVLADVVGPYPPNPSNPHKTGPPDGIPDLIQCNSNSPALPLGAGPGEWITPPIGDVQAPCVVYRGDDAGTWTAVTEHLSPFDPQGFNMRYPGGSPWGALAADLDADGDLDVFYSCGGFNTTSPNTLMRNEGDGTFKNVSAQAAPELVEQRATFGAACLDHDRDGFLDVYVANSSRQTVLYGGVEDPDPSDQLFVNQGDGTFAEVAAEAGCDLKSNGFSVTTGDLDRDGTTDVVVSCNQQYNKVLYGVGDGTYSFMAPASNPAWTMSLDDMVPDPLYEGSFDLPPQPAAVEETLPLLGFRSMPVELADFNGDGWLDATFASWNSQQPDLLLETALGATFFPGEPNTLYLNRGDQDGDGVGDGLFREAAGELGYGHVGGAMGLVAADLNGSGLPDLYVSGGGPNLDFHAEEDYLYVNEPSAWPADFQRDPDQPLERAFYEVGALAGSYGNLYMSHGMNQHLADGRLDVIVGNGGPAAFDDGQANVYWENSGNEDGVAYALREVALFPTASAAGAPGARVELVRDAVGGLAPQVMVQERAIGARFACQNAGPLQFGTGQDGLLYAGVTWPSGVRQGRLFWALAPTPERIELVEPTLSLALDGAYPDGGGLALTLRAEETGAQPAQGALLFARLGPGAAGFELDFLIGLVDDLVLAPGESLELAATVTGTPQGLYAAILVDATGAIANAAAFWHEPALEEPAGAAYEPPSPATAAAPSGGEDPRSRAVPVRRGLTLSAAAVRRGGGDALAPGTYALANGDLLAWDGARAELEVRGGLPGLASFRGDGLAVSLGDAPTCCDAAPDAAPELLRFDGVGAVRVDGRAFDTSGALRAR